MLSKFVHEWRVCVAANDWIVYFDTDTGVKQLPVLVLFLLRGQKSAFSRVGAIHCTNLNEIWMAVWHVDPLGHVKYHLGARDGYAAPKSWKFPLIGKEMPRSNVPLDWFLQMLGLTCAHLHCSVSTAYFQCLWNALIWC